MHKQSFSAFSCNFSAECKHAYIPKYSSHAHKTPEKCGAYCGNSGSSFGMCVIFLLMVKLNCILLKGNKTLLSSQLFGCHFSPCLLFSPFWTFCICFTTAYCFEITVVFMAAALAPEYNPLLSLLFMCLPRCGLLLCSSQLCCGLSATFSLLCSAVLSRPVVFCFCSALLCFFSLHLLCFVLLLFCSVEGCSTVLSSHTSSPLLLSPLLSSLVIFPLISTVLLLPSWCLRCRPAVL